MITHRPTGWNTWDFRGFNRLVYLHNGRTEITVQFALWDETVRYPNEPKRVGTLHDTFRWEQVRRLGPHAPLGLPAWLEFTVGDAAFRLRASADKETMSLRVEPLGKTHLRVVFLLIAPAGELLERRSDQEGLYANRLLTLRNASWPTDYFLNLADPYAVGAPGEAAEMTVAPRRANSSAATPRDAERVSAEPESSEAYESSSLSGQGALADAPQAMMQAINWNTLYDTRRRLVSSPVSRDWCYDWRGVLVFCWDTFFVGAMAAAESPALARANFEAVTAAIDELGMVPNYYMAHGAVSKDRSMPCLGAYMIWKTQLADPDLAWLKRIYPRLRKWHTYWMKNRNGNGDGLLAWGTNPTPHYEFPQLIPYNPSLQHTAKCAMYESGLDNSPMYDGVPFNETGHTLELADVGLNSYYAMDCEALAAIATAVGKPNDAAAYRREYEAVRRRINELLWDDAHGIYANRHWDGRFSSRWSPTSFFPLIAGVADQRQADRIVREHLLNDAEFWGRYVIPAISRGDPAFGDNDYWRGRIWGPFNFLVAEGLRRYRFDEVSADLARRGVEMFLHNWRKDGGIYENYNATTGEGGDVWNAARLYHWGGLMAFIAIQELIDVEPHGFLRFGSLAFPDAGVKNVHVGGHRYDVHAAGGLVAQRDGRPMIECTTRAIIRFPLRAGSDQPIEITATGAGRLTLHGAEAPIRAVRVNGGPVIQPRSSISTVVYAWS